MSAIATAQPKLTDYKAIIFDVYGTLADWETGIYNGLKHLLDKYPASQNWDRKQILEAFAAVEYDLEAQYPDMLYADLLTKISEVLEERLKTQSGLNTTTSTSAVASIAATAAGSSFGAGTSGLSGVVALDDTNPHVQFGHSIQNWLVFPDSSAALHELAKDFKLVVLSNVDHDSFRYTHNKLSLGRPASDTEELKIYSNPHTSSTTATSSAEEGQGQQSLYKRYWHPQQTPNSKSPFSLILTAQDTKCYKPALGGFNIALETIRSDPELLGGLGLGKDGIKQKVLVVAQSLTHDHEPAHQLGLRSVWIDRAGALTCKNVPEGVKRWTWKFETLGELAEAVNKEKSS